MKMLNPNYNLMMNEDLLVDVVDFGCVDDIVVVVEDDLVVLLYFFLL